MPKPVRRRPMLFAALAAIAAPPALAQVDPVVTTPASWVLQLGVTESTVNGWVAQGFRIIDVDRVGSNLYDAVFVGNSGDYANAGVTWLPAATEAQVTAALGGKRIADLQPWDSGGTTLLNAVLVSNSGADAVGGWGWLYAQTAPSTIDSWMTTNTLRPVSLSRYTVGGAVRYAAAAISNTGSAAVASKWHRWGATTADIATALSTNGGVITHVETATQGTPTAAPTFNVTAVSRPIRGWWYYTGLLGSEIVPTASRLGARVSEVARYTDQSGTTRFFVVFVDNTNAIESRQRALMDPLTDAEYGFHLRRVGGSVLAELNAGFPAEIASTMKIVHAVREVQRASIGLEGPAGLDTVVLNGDTLNPGECPDGVSAGSTMEPIRQVLWRMLNNSDNNATLLIANRCGGNAALNSWLSTQGLGGITINHTIGCLCFNAPNTAPARDICTIYERTATGQYFSAAWRDQLWAVMFGSNTFGTQRFDPVISQEALAAGVNTTDIARFQSKFWYRFKDGGYACTYTPSSTQRWGAVAGIVRLPFLTHDGSLDLREFTGMTFGHDGASIQVVYDSWAELFREQIREALDSWAAACPGDISGDGTINGADLGQLLSAWGTAGPGDLNLDGTVNGADLGQLLSRWGACN